jgi:LysR family transcriptional activator of dmlA
MKTPSLDDLRLVACLAKHASFTAAANELGLSQAYVSKRISELECIFKLRLFERTTRRVNLSPDGEIMNRWARDILDKTRDMMDEIVNAKGEPSGLLRISTSLRLGRNHVSHVLSLLRQRYQNLEIWLETIDRRVDLLAEDFDIDIRIGLVTEPHLIAHRVSKSDRILCASPKYLARRGSPSVLADLTHHDCLLFRARDHAIGVWRMEGPSGPESVKVTGPCGSTHSDIIRNWAIDGHGIVMLAIWDVFELLADRRLVHVLPAYRQHADIWAVTTARLSSSVRMRVCVEFLIENLRTGPFALATELPDVQAFGSSEMVL